MTFKTTFILSILLALICTYIKDRWGYSRFQINRMSPFGLFFQKWIENPISFFITIWILILCVWLVRSWVVDPSGVSGAIANATASLRSVANF